MHLTIDNQHILVPPGYKARLFLDGREHKDVIEALDEETVYDFPHLLVYVRDDKGQFVVDPVSNKALTQVLYGNVLIHFEKEESYAPFPPIHFNFNCRSHITPSASGRLLWQRTGP